ncbi:MAG: GNAT family N-acetyltransferase [Nitrososphaeria archaeon]
MTSNSNLLGDYEKIVTIKDGTQVLLRPIKDGDQTSLYRMFTSLSPETVYNRFFKLRRPFTIEEVTKMVLVNPWEEFAIVGVPVQPSDLSLVADARYYVEEEAEAEVSIVVQDKWQLKGLGTAMLNHLISIGRQNGIRQFYVYVLSDNAVMIHVAKKLGFKLKSQSYGITRLDLEQPTT